VLKGVLTARLDYRRPHFMYVCKYACSGFVVRNLTSQFGVPEFGVS
jgi:hypothetical protein